MMRINRLIAALIGRLRRSEAGVAAVEFALILPVMLLVYIGTLEASTLITVDRKVQSVAGAIGDLSARVEDSLSASLLQDYFRAASGIMTPYSPEAVVQVVTGVRVLNDGTTVVAWTRKYENGTYSSTTPYTVNDTYPLPIEMVNVARGHMVIAAEASYTYTPLLGLVIDMPVNLYRSSFFMPRFGDDITLAP